MSWFSGFMRAFTLPKSRNSVEDIVGTSPIVQTVETIAKAKIKEELPGVVTAIVQEKAGVPADISADILAYLEKQLGL